MTLSSLVAWYCRWDFRRTLTSGSERNTPRDLAFEHSSHCKFSSQLPHHRHPLKNPADPLSEPSELILARNKKGRSRHDRHTISSSRRGPATVQFNSTNDGPGACIPCLRRNQHSDVGTSSLFCIWFVVASIHHHTSLRILTSMHSRSQFSQL